MITGSAPDARTKQHRVGSSQQSQDTFTSEEVRLNAIHRVVQSIPRGQGGSSILITGSLRSPSPPPPNMNHLLSSQPKAEAKARWQESRVRPRVWS